MEALRITSYAEALAQYKDIPDARYDALHDHIIFTYKDIEMVQWLTNEFVTINNGGLYTKEVNDFIYRTSGYKVGIHKNHSVLWIGDSPYIYYRRLMLRDGKVVSGQKAHLTINKVNGEFVEVITAPGKEW